MNESGTRIIYIISHYYSTLYHHQTFHSRINSTFVILLLFHALKAFYINSQVRLFYKNKLFFMVYFWKIKSLIQWLSMDTILGWTKYTSVIVWYHFGYQFPIFERKICWLSREWLLFPDNLDQTIQFLLNWVTDYVTYYLCILIDLTSDYIKHTFK